VTRPVLLLAGLGHAHLFVLEAAWQRRLPPCELVVCTGDARHFYSGMVPGWLAGRYAPEELSLDVAALCAKAGARLVRRHVVGIDAARRRVRCDDGASMHYDICSVAVGSVASVASVAGAAAHAAVLKPLSGVQQMIDRLASPQLRHVVVVGGGLAGVEVALGVRARLSHAVRARAGRGAHPAGTPTASVTLVSASAALAPERGQQLSSRLAAAARRQGVALALGTPAVEVSADAVALRDGRVLPCDLAIWAGGPSAPDWLAGCGVPVDAHGFLLVDDTLCVRGRGAEGAGSWDLFAAGDCATVASAREVARSGVRAVRMGPVLARSLAAALRGEAPTTAYRPRSALALVNTGDGRAVASWRGLTAEGRWAMHWKDRLDRRFVERFGGPG
jgi:NADH dehydrogenase FAD-containing subunit